MSITDQLEEERREKVARAISAQGWSCEMHEPDYYCSQCQPLLLATADAAIEASGLPLRNAQLQAALAAVAEAEAYVQRMRGFGGTNAFLSGMEEMNRTIRRAIEEAGG